jgi:hypothetical protein
MVSTTEELIRPYLMEDPNWNLDVLREWLVRKKGIPQEVALSSIEKGLLTLDGGRKIPSHHGPTGFDQFVLGLAMDYLRKAGSLTTQLIDASLRQKVSENLNSFETSVQEKLAKMESEMLRCMKETSELCQVERAIVEEELKGIKSSYDELLRGKIDLLDKAHQEEIGKLKEKLSGGKLSKLWKVISGKL